MLTIQFIISLIGILLLLIVFELIRRNRLKEKYALLWLLSGIIILIFGLFPKLLYLLSNLMGTYYLTTLLIISFLFLLLIVLHFSTVISQLSEKNKELSQELSILDFKFRQLNQKYHQLISNSQ